MNEEKLRSLRAHLKKQQEMLANPNEKRKGDVEFAAYLKREISRTEKRIKELELALPGKG